MLSAVVIDDEAFILQGIQGMVDWEKRGIALAGTAGSGRAGLELIERARPDLVLTDIRMPGMDGLTMIRQAKNLIPDGVFIIFSGYNEFEYARQAISLGVVDYLEKPVTIETIDAALSRAVKLLASRGRSGEAEPLDGEEKVVARLLSGGIRTAQQLSEAFEDRPVPTFLNGAVLALRLGEGAEPEMLLKVSLREAEGLGWRAAALPGEEFLLALYHPARPMDAEAAAKKLTAAVQSALPEAEIFAGVSAPCRGFLELPVRAEEARRALGYALFRERGEAVFSREVEYGALPAGGGEGAGVLYCLRSGDWKGALGSVEKQLDFLESCRLSPELFRHECLELVYLGLQAAKESGGDFLFARPGGALLPHEEMARRKSFRELRAWVTSFFEELTRWSASEREKGGHKGVLAARQYILQNYQKSITLQELSDQVGMNPTYLSMLFKEQTGTTYIKFLTGVRLEHAKELLDRGKKVLEVSAQTGFLSPRHFSEVFKKTYGITPDQYRRSRG